MNHSYRAEFYEARTMQPLNLMLHTFRFHSTATDKKDLCDIAIREWQTWAAKRSHCEPNTWLVLQVWNVTFLGSSWKVAERYSRRYPKEELRKMRAAARYQEEHRGDYVQGHNPDADVAHYWDNLKNHDIG